MKTFYGWRIVVAGGALQFLQSLLLNQAFGASRPCSSPSVGGARPRSRARLARINGSRDPRPVLGWMIDRFGAQGLIRVGMVAFGIGFMLLSRIDSIAGFYGAFIVIALGASVCSNQAVSVVIIHWFERNRARALSAVQFGSALGGIFVVLIAWSIQSFGWRPTASRVGRDLDRHRVAARAHDPQPPRRTRANRPHRGLGRPVDGGRCAGASRLYGPRGAAHECFLAYLARPRVFAVRRFRDQRPRDRARQGGPGYTIAQASLVLTLVTVGQFFGVMSGWLIVRSSRNDSLPPPAC